MNTDFQIFNDEKLNAILDELEDMTIELSSEEEQALEEISKLKGSIKEHDLLKDFGDAALQGAQDYLNSFIDTSEIINDLKNPSAIRTRNESEVKFRMPSADPQSPNPTRSLKEAKASPYAANAKRDNSTMTAQGQRKLKYYEEVYKQRTKTISDHSNDLNGALSGNDIALAGIESFQFGPKVSLYSSDEYKTMYLEAGQPDNTARFIRDRNFDKYYEETYKEFGFSSKAQMKQWASENKFTIHESPTGMYLVPTDVHASESHSGEVSNLHAYLRGDISKQQLEKFERDTKIAKVEYETAVRTQRAGKAVAMGTAKILIQQFCSIVVTETYHEFKGQSDEAFTDRISRVIKGCGKKMKKDLKPTLNKLADGAVGNIATEVFTALNDFIFKTANNIFKVIRAMIGSIIRALKVLFGKEYTWQEKVFEAMKILSAGLVAALGFSLNEVIKDLLTGTGIAPLVVIAPFAADVISGLLASLMSAFVLMLFDSYKDRIQMQNALARTSLLQLQIAGFDTCISSLAAAQATVFTAQAAQIVTSAVSEMSDSAEDVDIHLNSIKGKIKKRKKRNGSLQGTISETRNGNVETSILLDNIQKQLNND